MKPRSGRHIVRRKNIYLPTEVWVNVFCFLWITINRPKLAQMVDRIGNRWFGEQLQFYLHEWGKHTLEHLRFTRLGVSKCENFKLQPLDYPQTAMPENIKFCKSFVIVHFDNHVFNFFHRIQSLFTADTKLSMHFEPEQPLPIDPREVAEQVGNARTILGHLLPFIDGIDTMSMDDRMLPVVQSFPPEKFTRIKVFDVKLTDFVQSAIEPMMEWLTTSSNDNSNEPKLLQLRSCKKEIFQQALETIRKQFIEATQSSTFVVIFFSNHRIPAITCENAIGEQLCGIRKRYWKFYVFRQQANAEAGDQLRQWVDGNVEKMEVYDSTKQCITLWKPTIGDGHNFAMPDLDVDEADEKEDEDKKPSTSKKMRICK